MPLEYHTAFLVCASCGAAHAMDLLIAPERGFQLKLPAEWQLRRYSLGATKCWAICPDCEREEATEAPTCIACGHPLSSHTPTCKTLPDPRPS